MSTIRDGWLWDGVCVVCMSVLCACLCVCVRACVCVCVLTPSHTTLRGSWGEYVCVCVEQVPNLLAVFNGQQQLLLANMACVCG